MEHQWQTFTDEEIMTQLAQREAGNCQYMYVNQLRWLSFVGHDLKEPFSLLAKDIPAPELPPELDELAQKRALQYFRVILLTTKDAESLNLEPQEIFAADILLDGRRVPVTVDFICASIHWFTLYSLGKYPLPQDWADDFAEYLRLRWPEYKGEPVTHDVLTYWLMYCEVDEREVQAPLERLKNDVKGFYRLCRGLAGILLLHLRVAVKRWIRDRSK